MSLIQHIQMGETTESVQFITYDFTNILAQGLGYSGLRVDKDGDLYARQPAGNSWTNIGPWLINGAANGFWVTRVVDAGTLTTDAGAGPLVCNVTRDYDVQIGTGMKTATVSFELSNDVSGNPILASVTYLFKVTIIDF